MADPYAERAEAAVLDGPAGDPPWLESVRARGGLVVETVAAAAALEGPASGFVAVLRRDSGALPPIARLAPPAALVHLIAADPQTPDADSAQRALAAMAAAPAVYLLKHGWVAGPEGSEGARRVDDSLLGPVLDAIASGQVGWEADPDFAYEVAASVPGLDATDADALCPRLLYGRHGRVYEHAAQVPEIKHRMHETLVAVPGLDPAVIAASGWPIEPTSDSWKD